MTRIQEQEAVRRGIDPLTLSPADMAAFLAETNELQRQADAEREAEFQSRAKDRQEAAEIMRRRGY